VEEIGGPETPGIGFALSIERFIAALEAEKVDMALNESIDCYLVSLGDAAKDYTVKLLHELRSNGFKAERDYLDRKLKAQFKAADRLQAKFIAVLGENELNSGIINLKDQATGEQREIQLNQFIETLKSLS
jgi:histidyl-tRNA synthetase